MSDIPNLENKQPFEVAGNLDPANPAPVEPGISTEASFEAGVEVARSVAAANLAGTAALGATVADTGDMEKRLTPMAGNPGVYGALNQLGGKPGSPNELTQG